MSLFITQQKNGLGLTDLLSILKLPSTDCIASHTISIRLKGFQEAVPFSKGRSNKTSANCSRARLSGKDSFNLLQFLSFLRSSKVLLAIEFGLLSCQAIHLLCPLQVLFTANIFVIHSYYYLERQKRDSTKIVFVAVKSNIYLLTWRTKI